MIGCLLTSSGNVPGCYETVGPGVSSSYQHTVVAANNQAVIATSQETNQNGKSGWHVTLVDDRVEVIKPLPKLVLGEGNEIPLKIGAPGLTSIYSYQTQFLGKDQTIPDRIEGSSNSLGILHHEDGSTYISLVPMRLGKVELTLLGKFGDGGISRTRVVLDVDTPKRKPERLIVAQTGDPKVNADKVTVYLNGMKGDGKLTNTFLVVKAQYGDVKEPMQIDPTFVKFTVRNIDDTQIIHLNESTGFITPIKLGHALIETRFGGLKNLTCVVVENKLDMDRYDHSRCEELLQPGEKAGQTTIDQ